MTSFASIKEDATDAPEYHYKYTRYNSRSNFYSLKKELKGSKFYIHENLTMERQKFLVLVKEKYPDLVHKVWVLDGRIHVKTPNGQKAVIVNSNDITKFKNQ